MAEVDVVRKQDTLSNILAGSIVEGQKAYTSAGADYVTSVFRVSGSDYKQWTCDDGQVLLTSAQTVSGDKTWDGYSTFNDGVTFKGNLRIDNQSDNSPNIDLVTSSDSFARITNYDSGGLNYLEIQTLTGNTPDTSYIIFKPKGYNLLQLYGAGNTWVQTTVQTSGFNFNIYNEYTNFYSGAYFRTTSMLRGDTTTSSSNLEFGHQYSPKARVNTNSDDTLTWHYDLLNSEGYYRFKFNDITALSISADGSTSNVEVSGTLTINSSATFLDNITIDSSKSLLFSTVAETSAIGEIYVDASKILHINNLESNFGNCDIYLETNADTSYIVFKPNNSTALSLTHNGVEVKMGFFGVNEVGQQTSGSGTVNDVIYALQQYGLLAT